VKALDQFLAAADAALRAHLSRDELQVLLDLPHKVALVACAL
jgi:hypothetical protein